MNNIIEKLILKSSDDIKIQIFRYLIAGGIAFVVDNGVYNFLVIILNVNHIISNVISFIFGLITNYFISRQWVFNKRNHNLLKDLTLFSLIGVVGLFLSSLIIFLLIDCGILLKIFSFLSNDAAKAVAKLISSFIVLFWNFIGRKVFVFKE